LYPTHRKGAMDGPPNGCGGVGGLYPTHRKGAMDGPPNGCGGVEGGGLLDGLGFGVWGSEF
jgi:hypothetical protein